jgi:hypothetical protein
MPRISRRAPCTKPAKLCVADGCEKFSTFGTEWRKPVHCAAHKTVDERNVMDKRCVEPGCEKQPTFGAEWRKPVHCAIHKTDGERDVVNKRCIEHGCGKQPTFGTEWKKPVHCAAHRTDGESDVMNKRCIGPGCEKQSSFGAEWRNPLHCAEHKTDDERNVVSKRCVESGCNKQPNFGTEWKKPIHCVDHKTDADEDVTHARCTGRDGHPCPTRERAYYGDRCRYCADESEVKAVRKKTEARCVKRIIELLGPLVTAQEQLHVPFKCADFVGSCAYVDLVIDHPRIRVLLEVDECRHFAYAVECERRRMEAVAGELRLQSSDARPIAWVRFNPDDGTVPAGAAAQRRRCREAAAKVRELIADPRGAVIPVNYDRACF